MQKYFILIMHYAAVQCYQFHGLLLNKIETAPSKTNDCGKH